jgi:hypothetical protein
MKHKVVRSVLTILLAAVAVFDIAEGDMLPKIWSSWDVRVPLLVTAVQAIPV